MGLVLSYIFNPVEALREVRRLSAPGRAPRPIKHAAGHKRLGLFTRLLEEVDAPRRSRSPAPGPKPGSGLDAVVSRRPGPGGLGRSGFFDFFDPEKMGHLLGESGWDSVQTIPSFGTACPRVRRRRETECLCLSGTVVSGSAGKRGGLVAYGSSIFSAALYTSFLILDWMIVHAEDIFSCFSSSAWRVSPSPRRSFYAPAPD